MRLLKQWKEASSWVSSLWRHSTGCATTSSCHLGEKNGRCTFTPRNVNRQITSRRKTVAGSYSVHGHQLQNVTTAKNLEVKISSDQRWDVHIAKVTSKANSTLYFVWQNVCICSLKAQVAAYKDLVRSILEYTSPVWDPYTVCCIYSID